jgi:lipopolysaccharide transport system ATP-binding protein
VSAVSLKGITKRYRKYSRQLDRLREVVTGRPHHDEISALHPVDLTIAVGEVVGVIGLNGAGKSTLLKLIAGTLSPSSGEVSVNGRISALLELGTGFHPDMTGRANVLMSCAVSGMPLLEAKARYREIVRFSGLPDRVMEQPVKTLSSGMVARLAFSVATAVEPEILIVDELLSVGDGAFSRKSFDRIMEFKRKGHTMLFCSHSLYQVEAICDRVVWLNEGQVAMEGEPPEVVTAYKAFLNQITGGDTDGNGAKAQKEPDAAPVYVDSPSPTHFTAIEVSCDGMAGKVLDVLSGTSDVVVKVAFASDPDFPCPAVALRISDVNGLTITSLSSANDLVSLERQADGNGTSEVTLPKFPLLKGRYWLTVLLLSEDAVHVYEAARMIVELRVRQRGLEQGVVSVPRAWKGRQLPA